MLLLTDASDGREIGMLATAVIFTLSSQIRECRSLSLPHRMEWVWGEVWWGLTCNWTMDASPLMRPANSVASTPVLPSHWLTYTFRYSPCRYHQARVCTGCTCHLTAMDGATRDTWMNWFTVIVPNPQALIINTTKGPATMRLPKHNPSPISWK